VKTSFFLCFLFSFFCAAAAAQVGRGTPEWIWKADGDREGSDTTKVSRKFTRSGKAVRATLRATADFASLQVSLNGSRVLDLDPYDPPREVEVTRWLAGGENVIAVTAPGVEGPSAFALALEIVEEKGASALIHSDISWSNLEGGKVVSLGPVEPHRWALNRLPEISPFAEYNQWKEALEKPDAATLSPLPQGFVIEKIRDAAEGEDSWVSLAIDARDRLYIGKEQKGILR